MAQQRLQKILARAGVASRRKAEELIEAGRVRVDGRVIDQLGAKADIRRQRVELDGRPLQPERLTYVVLHKPRGVVTTLRDPEGRRTASDLVRGLAVRVVPVGRLDYQTSGVLLMTNDGELSAALQHPRTGVPRVYVAKVRGSVTDEALRTWNQSIEIDGRRTCPAMVRRLRYDGDKTWLEITLSEGRNRHVRRLGEAAGQPVLRLARTSYAGVTADGLLPGQWRPLSVDELSTLRRAYGVPKHVHAPALAAKSPPRRALHRPAQPASHRRSRRGSKSAPEREQTGRAAKNRSRTGAPDGAKPCHGRVQSRSKKPALRS
ncbi:MAG: rRNA pseudouridine synthase [Polyangiaceae bacterium]|nr:rRNA pseudouridine synthase [Polyangiaceae bacterium]